MAGRLAGTQVRVSAPGPLAPPLYLDNKATLYDLSPVASFVDHPTGRVRAAIIPRSADVPTLTAHLRAAQVNHHIFFPFMFLPSLLWVCYRFCRAHLSHRRCAQADGAEIALLTEEDFGASRDNGAGEPLSGAHVKGVSAAAKALGMYVVCPFRIAVAPGESYNGAVVIDRNGTIVKATRSGATSYQKVMPVLVRQTIAPLNGQKRSLAQLTKPPRAMTVLLRDGPSLTSPRATPAVTRPPSPSSPARYL
jgi:hypothetical protein